MGPAIIVPEKTVPAEASTGKTTYRLFRGVIQYTRRLGKGAPERRHGKRLELETREVGRVTVVRCKGRIVSGGEQALRAHVAWLLRDRRSIVSASGRCGVYRQQRPRHHRAYSDQHAPGAGTTSNSVTFPNTSAKCCNSPISPSLFDSHDSEDNAVAAFYRAPVQSEKPVPMGRSVLCIDSNADVVTYIREVLLRAGYDVHTSSLSPRLPVADARHPFRFAAGRLRSWRLPHYRTKILYHHEEPAPMFRSSELGKDFSDA